MISSPEHLFSRRIVVRLMRIFSVAILPLTAISLVGMAIQDRDVNSANVFQEPARRMQAGQLQMQLLSLYSAGQHQAALDRALKILQLTPLEPAVHYNAACLLTLVGRPQEGLKSLDRAVQLGFRDSNQILNDKDLAVLREDPQFEEILEASKQPFELPADHPERAVQPGQIQNGVAMVTEQNTCWISSKGVLVTTFESVEGRSEFAAPAAPVVEAATGNGPADSRVRDWFREGTAAGHVGDLYDNRDRDHSNLDLRKFPQLTRVEYGPEAQAVRADWGVQIHQLFDRPTLGNSSTAQVGTAFWRSNPRMFLFSDVHTKRVYNQYVNNHLYVYPEHNDYDVEYGDVYPANVPYCVISQGSSGSDQPFLESLALTMAAFRPAVKQKLMAHGILMPTVQAILRRCGRSIETDEDYLSGKAHPVVFQSSELNAVRMVEMAHEMQTDRLPPMVQLRVVEENSGEAGRDYFYPGPGERLFDTPAAIARIFRSVASERRMVVDASGSRDANQKALTFRWVVLQGDPSLVEIRPLDDSGSRAEIVIRWHPSYPSATRPEILSNRVDIGVFAFNQQYYSAPGLICSFSLNNEKRQYDDQGRILSVDYADSKVGRNYVDPFLDLKKDWRDEYVYSVDGRLTGWTRYQPDGKSQEFHHDGTMIVKRDALGRAAETRVVRYQAVERSQQPAGLKAVLTEEAIFRDYASPDDFQGVARRQQ